MRHWLTVLLFVLFAFAPFLLVLLVLCTRKCLITNRRK